MSRLRVILAVVGALLGLLLQVPPVQAQATTRTWVSAVGADTNPCSRTAPCRTFAGALSKTAPRGEIYALDAGGFADVTPLTITKSITISAEGVEAGVQVSGTNGIVINAAAADEVILRGLTIEGSLTGLVGIKVLGGLASLHVEKCTIHNFRGTNGSGIEVTPTAAGTTKVFIKDTTVRGNGNGTGGGIFINPGGSAIVKASLDNVRLEDNVFGLKVQGTSNVSVSDSVAAGNAFAGFSAATSPAVLTIERSVSAHNGTGVVCTAGTTVRIGNTSISGNTTAVTPGACSSFKNNDIDVAVTVTPINPQ